MTSIPQIGTFFTATMLVIMLILVLAYVAKKIKTINLHGTKDLQILNALNIGPKEKLILVQVNNKQLLLGITTHNISTLLVLNEPGGQFSNYLDKLTNNEAN